MLRKYFLFSFLLLISFFAFTNDQKNSLIETYNKTYDRELVDIVIKDNIDIKGKVTSAGSLKSKHIIHYLLLDDTHDNS